MKMRINYAKTKDGPYQVMRHLEDYLAQSSVEEKLLHLVKLRASQINHCAYCIDMHWKDLRALGESEQRLYGLDAWRESPYYTERERAALAWTESVTLVAETGIPDEDFEYVRQHFTEKELIDLTFAIATINVWNRLSVAARVPAGTYESPYATAGV